MAKRQAKYPVPHRNLVLRINQRLKADGRMLKATRSALAEELLGKFYMVDANNGGIVEQDLNLSAFARQIGACRNGKSCAL